MMRSLFSGVAGLKNHQTRMDVIGNNIANVNTTGFKASRVNFQDILSQNMQGASAAQGNRGGTNPKQIGLGMGVASIDTIFTDGSYQTTGKQTDLSIQGQGFFIVQDGPNQYYTRAGNFDFDVQGNYLVPGTGLKVVGWMADANGVINASGATTNIKVPVGSTMPAKSTTSYDFINNLSADAEIGKIATSSVDVYDSLGNAHTVNTTFVKIANNKWLSTSKVTNGTITGGPVAGGAINEITFDDEGKYIGTKTVTAATLPTPQTPGIAIDNLQLNNDLNSTSTAYHTVLDSNGVAHTFKMTFKNTQKDSAGPPVTDGKWDYTITDLSDSTASAVKGTVTWPHTAGGPYTFSTPAPAISYKEGGITRTVDMAFGGTQVAPGAGTFVGSSAATYTVGATSKSLAITPNAGAKPMSINTNYNTLTQFGGESTVRATGGDGYAAGTLDLAKLTIDQSGIIVGGFTNGRTQNLGQVALAVFNNPGGLNKVGDSLYAKSNNSGDAQIGTGGSGGRGTFTAGTLEMSNVDLAQQFSDMIITQRGFQANSKIITTTDEMLEQLASLKR